MPLPNNSLYLATDHLYDTSPPSAGVLNYRRDRVPTVPGLALSRGRALDWMRHAPISCHRPSSIKDGLLLVSDEGAGVRHHRNPGRPRLGAVNHLTSDWPRSSAHRSRDLNSGVAGVVLDYQVASDCGEVAADGADLGVVQVATFDLGHLAL